MRSPCALFCYISINSSVVLTRFRQFLVKFDQSKCQSYSIMYSSTFRSWRLPPTPHCLPNIEVGTSYSTTTGWFLQCINSSNYFEQDHFKPAETKRANWSTLISGRYPTPVMYQEDTTCSHIVGKLFTFCFVFVWCVLLLIRDVYII